jgi:hypothetical protein
MEGEGEGVQGRRHIGAEDMSQALKGAHRTILVEWIREDVKRGKLKRGDYMVTDAEWIELLKEAEGK